MFSEKKVWTEDALECETIVLCVLHCIMTY